MHFGQNEKSNQCGSSLNECHTNEYPHVPDTDTDVTYQSPN